VAKARAGEAGTAVVNGILSHALGNTMYVNKYMHSGGHTMRKVGLWLTSTMLAYSLIVPVAMGAASDLDEKRSSAVQEEQQKVQQKVQQEKQEKHKHSHAHPHKKLTSEEIQNMRLKKLQRLAAYFDISTEGKSLDQLKKEVDQAKKEQPDKWEAFKQEFRAKKLEKIRDYAKQKGIDVEGKTLEQLHDELHELEERQSHS